MPYALITAFLWLASLWWIALSWTVVLLLCLLLVCLILFRSPGAVTYTLDTDALALRYGRLVDYRIPYRTITNVRRYTLTSQEHAPLDGSWAKLPGLDTTAYRTEDAGTIKMLATTSAGPIVLIESESGNYGINPTDEEGFISALRQRIRWDGDVLDDAWNRE